MKQILALLLCCIIFKADAATTIAAGTLSSAHWTLAGSPYKITGHIIVANNDSLVIDPGVVVEFQGRYKLFCNGKIIANGTPSQHILFTVPVANQSIGWLGIRYDNTPTTNGQSSFKYCTLEYGNAVVTGDDLGGGMYFNNFSKCIIANSVIRNCYANLGGAVSCSNSSPTFLQDTFYNNNSNVGGDCLDLSYSNSIIDSCMFIDRGIVCYHSSIKVTNCYFNKCIYQAGVSSFSSPGSGYVEIAHNVFDSCSQYNGGGGGGVLLSNAQGKIEHNIFKNCVSGGGGGAISCWTQTSTSNSSNVLISNNLFYGNKSRINLGAGAPFGGGAISFSNCSGKVINNTIVNNNSDTAGGAIICFGGSSPSFYNNIIYNNTTKAGVENIFVLDNASDPNFYNNDIQGGYAGINTNGTPLISANVNNIDSLPNFTNPSADLYTLNTGSPCIDKGDITSISSKIPSKDLGGAVRVMGGIIDMGCYESLGSIPCDSPTNLRVNPITSTTAVVSWDTTTTATGYEYYILPHPSTTPTTAVATSVHSVLASGLSPSTTYDVCVRSQCAGGGYSTWICDTFTTTSGLGIPQIAANNVSVYPNPSNGTFNISLENDSYTNATIMVYDLTGRMIASKPMSTANETISLGNAAKGVYTVHILTNNTVHTRSITIQ